ncbi:alcohol oxidase [Agrocybe pediades]|nr:alcohol oxidase [Agrocybe pediades]
MALPSIFPGLLLVSRLVIVAASICDSQASIPSKQDIQTFLSKQYDYVIIGGGTAGVALGVRLAKNSQRNVAILEAGIFHKNDPLVDIPGLNGQAVGNPLYDWSFVSTPQENAGGRQIPIPRGKMIGGSSGLNGLAWNRASSIEYDAWQAFGGSSWSWSGLLPFFKKSETTMRPDENPYPGITKAALTAAMNDIPRIDGLSGPVSVSHNSFYFDIVNTFVKALNSLGISTNAEPGDGNSTGVYNTYASLDRKKGVRSYSANAYYCVSGAPTNIDILSGAHVTQILFKNTTSREWRATGVEFSALSQKYTVESAKEVILAAGAIQTPQILELSGIGNTTILKSHGVKPLIDLPQVGENLQEHLFAGVQWRLKPGQHTFDILRNNASFALEEMAKYNDTRRGLFTELDSTVAFVPTGAVMNEQGVSNLLSAFDADFENNHLSPFQRTQLQIQRTWLVEQKVAHYEIIQWSRGSIAPATNESYIVAIGGVSHPTSRGTVHISSNDSVQPPAINPRFLSTRFDELSQLALLKFVMNIGKQPQLRDVIDIQTNPDPTAQLDEDLLSWIRTSSVGGDHLIGTAVMAPQALGGVVSPELKVYGTTNLRIADASIFPLHIAAHTQATVYAIAEMAAQIIQSI